MCKKWIEPKKIPNLEINLPNLKYYKSGKMNIGNLVSKKKIHNKFLLDIEDIKRHVMIYGQTGTGKTTFIKNFLISFYKNYPKIPFLLFEFKGEYNNLEEIIPNTMIIRPGINFFFNLFDNDIFEKFDYAEILFDSLKSCQILEDMADFSPQMQKVLIEVLQKICIEKNEKKKNWKEFVINLEKYEQVNYGNIPLLNQTIISIKNRLRRYYEGPLKKIFNEKQKNQKISSLLSRNCVIDLGSILNLGGTKEDVIFFANLILKWIWKNSINKEPTDDLLHLTIFEDVSYIASKKIIEISKLTSYLEDIANLLRGKGEALITITTTLEISKNLIRNSGSKFFFKFNERFEDVIYNIGIQYSNSFNINELFVGYCLCKIDSIPEPFLLKSKNIIKANLKSSKKKKKVKNEKKMKKKKHDTRNNIQNQERENVQYKNEILKNVINCDELLINIKQAEELFLIDNYFQAFNLIKKIVDNLKYMSKNYNILSEEEKKKISQFGKNQVIIEKKKEKAVKITPNEILVYLNFINTIVNKIKQFQKIENNIIPAVLNENTPKIDEKEENDSDYLFHNLRVYYFNPIIGPELYYEVGNKIEIELIKKKIESSFDNDIGELWITLNEFTLYINIFEIDSNWARGKKELIQIVYIKKKFKDTEVSRKKTITILHQYIKMIKEKKELFYAFYLADLKKKEMNKEIILNTSKNFKKSLNETYQKINKHLQKQKSDYNFSEKISFDHLNHLIDTLMNIK